MRPSVIVALFFLVLNTGCKPVLISPDGEISYYQYELLESQLKIHPALKNPFWSLYGTI